MSDTQTTGSRPKSRPIDFSKVIDTACLENQSVVVTGGANGIGRAFVIVLADAGAHVTFLDFNEAAGRKLAEDLTGTGKSVQFVQADVQSWDEQVHAFETALSTSPTHSIDIVITAAGLKSEYVPHWLKAQSLDDDKLPTRPDTRCIDVNMTSTYLTMYLALHYFRKSLKPHTKPRTVPSKQIVFVGSLASYGSSTGHPNYAGAKYGVRGMWRAIREEHAILGSSILRTSLLAPWYVDTSLVEKVKVISNKVGVPMATTDDCVDALMRIVCDEDVHGRAIIVAPHGKSFDACDDASGLDGGREYLNSFTNGAYGADLETLQKMFGEVRKMHDAL